MTLENVRGIIRPDDPAREALAECVALLLILNTTGELTAAQWNDLKSWRFVWNQARKEAERWESLIRAAQHYQ